MVERPPRRDPLQLVASECRDATKRSKTMSESKTAVYDLVVEHVDGETETVRGVTDIASGDGSVWYTAPTGDRIGVLCDGYVIVTID
jgi:hypothetical protein